MGTLSRTEIKVFLPAQDFALSQRFYEDLGFTKASEGGGIAYFHHGACAFLLQDWYVQAFAENLQMSLLVEDAQAWFDHVRESDLANRYGVRVTPLEDQPWAMRDFTLTDPAGVCWRIGQNLPRAEQG
ncbi:MAG: glyoxalase [Comamonadaceae bacterium]|nr:MAG: glyoxalase [Comamonadaceae bacterium]